MKKPASCLAIFMLVMHMATGQTWNEIIKRDGPVKFSEVVKAFEKEKKLTKDENEKRVTAEEQEIKGTEEEFENKDHLYYKWYLNNHTRLDADGNVTNTLWRTLQAETEQQRSSSAESMMPHGTWQSIGPTNINSTILNPFDAGHGVGRVNSIAFSAGNLFLGTASGGAWKGTGSNTWQSITENVPNLSVSSICINPINSSIIYLLTGDGDGYWNGPSNLSVGVIKSIDGGNSWMSTGLAWGVDTLSIAGFRMIMHPVNPDILYVAASNGIYRTSDGGTSWTQEPGFFTDIEFKPGNPNFMYAVSNTHFYTTTTGGTGGWTQMTQPVFSQPDSRMAIAVSADKPNWVYVLVGSKASPFFIGLWLSKNSGVSFGPPRSSMTPCIFCENSNTASFATYNMAFTANPANAAEIWMGATNVFSSSDTGNTWTKRSSYYSFANDIMHPDIHVLEFNAAGELWCGNDGGIFKYTPGDILKQWSIQFEGLNISQFYRLGLDATPPYDLNFFGAQDNGLQRYDGDGDNENVYFGDGGEVAVDYIDAKFYFNGNGRLLKSDVLLGVDITPNTAACGCADASYNNLAILPNRPIKIHPLHHDTIYHGLSCLWMSPNAGTNFSLVPGFDCSGSMINDLDVTPVSKWAVKDNKVLRETSSGVWTNVTNGLSANTEIIVRIAAHTTNPLEAYVCYGGYNSTIKVFYTTDGGINWNNLSAGLPNTPINDILYQDGSDGGYYAATDIGVYYINNFMFFWIPFRNGMPSVVVTELEINYGQNKIYASTYGRGGWISDLIEPCPATDQTASYPSLPSYSTIQANNTVTANSVFNQGYGQNVTLLSGLEISFTPGFEASNGTEVTARIQNCPALKPADGQNLTGNYILSKSSAAHPASEKHIAASEFIIAPNPAKEFCTVSIALKENSDLKIEVVNMLGEKISDVTDQKNCLPGNYRFPIPVRQLKNGIYFIKTDYNHIQRTDKLVVTD